jgi:hypothetical protein
MNRIEIHTVSYYSARSDDHMENLEDQVINLCGSVGKRPSVLSPNVPEMELWMSGVGISNYLQGVKDEVDHPALLPSRLALKKLQTVLGRRRSLRLKECLDWKGPRLIWQRITNHLNQLLKG